MSQTVLGQAAPPRLCPGPAHAPETRRCCAGKHCVANRHGVLVLWWSAGSILTLADVLESYSSIREVSEGYRLPLVVHLQGMVGMTAEARTVLLEGRLNSRIAFVGTGPVDGVIAAFLEHALTETRYFERFVDAEIWAGST